LWDTTLAGGGNTFAHNLFQSSTGSYDPGTRVGIAIDLYGAGLVVGNYFERYQYHVRAQPAVNVQLIANHDDNNDARYGLVTGSLVPSIVTYDRGVEAFALAPLSDTYNLSGNKEKIWTSGSAAFVSGNGSYRTGTYLGTDNARVGQMFVILATSWPFELVESTTGDFGQFGSSMIFGKQGVSYAPTVYRAAAFIHHGGKWYCVWATAWGPGADGGTMVSFVKHNNVTIHVTHRVHYLHGNGSHRTGCRLSNGVCDGQRVTLIGYTWGVALDGSASNVEFGSAGVPNFSGASGAVQAMELVWLGAREQVGDGKWYEVSRTMRPKLKRKLKSVTKVS